MYCGKIVKDETEKALKSNTTKSMHFYMQNGLILFIQIVKRDKNGKLIQTVTTQADGITVKNTSVTVYQSGKCIDKSEDYNIYLPYSEISFVGNYAD